MASFSNSLGSYWSGAAAGGGGAGVEIDRAAGENCGVTQAGVSGNNYINPERHSLILTPHKRDLDEGKIKINSGRNEYLQKIKSMPEFRSEAEICFQRSELTIDRAAKLRWLTLAEAWLKMADNMSKREGYDGNGESHQHLQRESGGRLSLFLTSSVPNRRKYPRHRVLKEGKITNPHMHCLANVIIRDLSENGAQVQLLENQNLPDDFGLYFVAQRLLYPAVARWRNEKALGIQFVAEPRPTDLQKASHHGL